MYIYCVTNKVNGKKYIGQTTQNLRRYFSCDLLSAAMSGKTTRPFLFNAIRKYGKDAFEIEALAIVRNKIDLDYYEQALISELRTRDSKIGYNLADGGGGSLGHVLSDESKEKISKAQKAIGNKPSVYACSLGGRTAHKLHPELASEGARRSREFFAENPSVAINNGRVQGLKNVQSGHLDYSRHARWHVKRNKKNDSCIFCVEENK